MRLLVYNWLVAWAVFLVCTATRKVLSVVYNLDRRSAGCEANGSTWQDGVGAPAVYLASCRLFLVYA